MKLHETQSSQSNGLPSHKLQQATGTQILIESDSDTECVMIPCNLPLSSDAKSSAPVYVSGESDKVEYKLGWSVVKSNQDLKNASCGGLLFEPSLKAKTWLRQNKKRSASFKLVNSSDCEGPCPTSSKIVTTATDKQKRITKHLRTLRHHRQIVTHGASRVHNPSLAQKALCDWTESSGAIMPYDSGPLTRLNQAAMELISKDLAKGMDQQIHTSKTTVTTHEESALAIADDFYKNETAMAITEAFVSHCEGSASATRRELQQLRPALRRNANLCQSILRAGPIGLENLTLQDKQEWATEELKEKRMNWKKEALEECTASGGIRACCGLRCVE